MKTIKKLPLVTIAVSAFNEEANIERFLKSVILQKEEGFVIKDIWVYSDGSTDKTVVNAKKINSPKIKIFADKKRIGKSSRLNDIYSRLSSDFLVQADADVVMAHPYVVHDIIQPLMKEKRVGMCGGNPTPLTGSTFFERMVKIAFEPYQDFRSKVRGGDNVFSAVGQILAYKKDLVKEITVPHDMVTNDIFTYFSCLTLGWEYRYVKSAVVLFQPPTILKDMVKQNTRFHTGYNRMFDYFSKELVDSEFAMPKVLYLWTLCKQALKHPVLSSSYYAINMYSRYKSFTVGKELNAKWPVAWTTKKLT